MEFCCRKRPPITLVLADVSGFNQICGEKNTWRLWAILSSAVNIDAVETSWCKFKYYCKPETSILWSPAIILQETIRRLWASLPSAARSMLILMLRIFCCLNWESILAKRFAMYTSYIERWLVTSTSSRATLSSALITSLCSRQQTDARLDLK